MFRSVQARYSTLYVVVILLMLFILNLYSDNAANRLVFQSKESSLKSKAVMIAASFSGMDSLTTPGVSQVMGLLEDLDTTRTVVTDGSGMVLYDSSMFQNIEGEYALFPEIVQALEGNDVFYCTYTDGAFESRAAMPILYQDSLIGAAYLMEYDSGQAGIVHSLRSNMTTLSLGLAVSVVVLSIILSWLFSSRMRKIMISLKALRSGNYEQKLDIRGNDELGLLAAEFNKLTDRLETKEQEQRQFVSDASHELKTPLASIRLLTDSILQNQMDQQTMLEFVEDIGNEADRLTRVSAKLLTLSRVDNAQGVERELCQPSLIVEKVLRMLRPLANARRIQLQMHTNPDCTLLSLEDDLYQILFNLVENGIKYNRDGGTVTVFLDQNEKDVIIRIQDTGVGIPPEELPHIFDRFYRVDKARSREAGGAGLGLSIVRELVRRHQGSITVQSEFGSGTIFTIVFPAPEEVPV